MRTYNKIFRHLRMCLPGPIAAAPRPKLYAAWIRLSLDLLWRLHLSVLAFRSLLIHGSSDPPGQGLEIWDEAAQELLRAMWALKAWPCGCLNFGGVRRSSSAGDLELP